MTTLAGIPVRVVHRLAARDRRTGQAQRASEVLAQIGGLLDGLLECGEGGVIDLRAIEPGLDHDGLACLEVALGIGEVHATVSATGETVVRETGFPAVWHITHRDSSGSLRTILIDVSWCPEILHSQRADAEAGQRRLRAKLVSEQAARCSDGLP